MTNPYANLPNWAQEAGHRAEAKLPPMGWTSSGQRTTTNEHDEMIDLARTDIPRILEAWAEDRAKLAEALQIGDERANNRIAVLETERDRLAAKVEQIEASRPESVVSWNESSQATLNEMCGVYAQGKMEVRQMREELEALEAEIEEHRQWAQDKTAKLKRAGKPNLLWHECCETARADTALLEACREALIQAPHDAACVENSELTPTAKHGAGQCDRCRALARLDERLGS